MGTPHNEAAVGAFAKTVLMPGDPLRAKFIAETFLQDAKLVNNVRGIQGYTGTYQGTAVSVMASGMGMPSIGIYSYELFHLYDVDNIIRIGSAGAISPKLRLRDVVLAQGACTDSNYAHQYGLSGTFAPIANFTLLETAVAVARRMGIEPPVGNLLSSDVFYNKTGDTLNWGAMGVLAVDMEAAALYCNAAEAGKRALAMCTISDSMITGEELPADQRQTSFTQMMEIALGTAVEMARKQA
jgi:purine-nucleoside phosphorylase